MSPSDGGRVRVGLATVLALVALGCGGSAAVPSTPAATTPPPRTAAPSATLPPTPSAAPVVGAGESWLAFGRVTGQVEIALIRPDGTGLHNPAADVRGQQTNPDWSPDGDKLVFVLTVAGRDDLWIVGADGSGARLLVDCEAPCLFLDDPAWSPDGLSVLYSRVAEVDGAHVGTLEVVNVADGSTEVLATPAPNDFYAGQRWAPDGRSVVLEVFHLAAPDVDAEITGVTLAVIDLDAPTAEGRTLVAPELFAETAAWSPLGTEIVFGAFAEAGDEARDLYAIHPDGTGVRPLTSLAEDGGNATHPDVTPDGQHVLFVASFPGQGRDVLASIPIGGGEIVSATGGAFIDGVHPRIRPSP